MNARKLIDDCDQDKSPAAPVATGPVDWKEFHDWYEEETKLGGNGR